MARRSIEDLPAPSPGYFITALPAPPADAMGYARQTFESSFAVAREDRIRIRLCEQASLVAGRQQRRLMRKLRARHPPKTLASSRRWRRLRIRIVGAVWKLVAEGPWDHRERGAVALISVTPRSWVFTPAQLREVRGEQLIARLRSWLNRNGAAQADGFLIACLHGEFEPGHGVYRVHVHGVAAGSMISVVDNLRKLPDLNSSLDPEDGWKRAPPRIKISRAPPTELPHAISYQFKGWWPSRWIGLIQATGETKRARWANRIRNRRRCRSGRHARSAAGRPRSADGGRAV